MPHSEWPTSVPVMLNRQPGERSSVDAVRVVPTHRSSDRPAPPRARPASGAGQGPGQGGHWCKYRRPPGLRRRRRTGTRTGRCRSGGPAVVRKARSAARGPGAGRGGGHPAHRAGRQCADHAVARGRPQAPPGRLQSC